MSVNNVNLGFPIKMYQEGETRFFAPDMEIFEPTEAPVFYNPEMELSRDISVLALQAYKDMLNREMSVCEPLSGCGIRGLRYAKEVNGTVKVVINDKNPIAAKLMALNVKLNNLEDKVQVFNREACALMLELAEKSTRFEVVDIDPFGSPSPFLDSAFKVIKSRTGMLCLTATDMAPLCGVHKNACIRKYGSVPLRVEYCHELAVRILISYVVREAAKYEIGVEPLFAYYYRHHVRVFLKLSEGAGRADKSIRNLGYVLHCRDCNHREVVEEVVPSKIDKCVECGSQKVEIGGPIWTKNIISKDFCSKMMDVFGSKHLGKGKRVEKMLRLAILEANAPPFYHIIPLLSKQAGVTIPPKKMLIEHLRSLGYIAVETHFNPNAIKTNANRGELVKIIKELTKGA
ncbi:MAG: tRNA (guanine(10)-N(2))-dimethyltransferase [Candidatus Baldrarchaeia archaeon]